MRIERPVFVIGSGRSGTTAVFEALASHPEVGWWSQYASRFPQIPAVSLLSRLPDWSDGFRKSIERSDQKASWLEKLRVGPIEAYDLWEACCGEKFRHDYLLGVKATSKERDAVHRAVAGCLRFMGKRRFATKITGPGRVGYIDSLFEDAIFVNLVRDGRAVVQSLLAVEFWRESARMHEPAWRNGLTAEELERWERADRSPLALAAIQWRAVLDRTRDEARDLPAGRYAELRYEDFVRHPHEALEELLAFAGLPTSDRLHRFLDERFQFRDMNFQWSERFEPEEIELLESIVGDRLAGRGPEDDTSPASGPYLRGLSASPGS